MKTSVLTKYYNEGYKAEEVNSCQVPLCYTSVEEEYEAIREKIAIIDGIGYGVFNVSGDGAADYLDSIASKDIIYMNIGTISECLILNEEADVLGVVFIERIDYDYVVLIPPESAEAVFAWMQEKATDDVVIKDMTDAKSLIFLEGHKSWKLVQDVLKVDVETIPLRGLYETKWNDSDMVVSRIGRSGEYGYAILADDAVIKEVVKVFLDSSDFEVKFAGSEAMDICMLEIRQLNLKYESKEAGNLFEMAMQWLIQFEKEDYFGCKSMKELFEQERTMLSVGFICKDKKEFTGKAEVLFDDEVIGEVSYSKCSPKLGYLIGIAKIKDELAVSGIYLDVKDSEGSYKIETISSPFLRPISWDEKME